MADATRELQIVLSAKDEASSRLRAFGGQIEDLVKSAQAGSALIAGAFTVIAKNAVDTAANFQSARISFETFLGSGERAGKLLQQLSDFAVKTPFDLPQVIDGTRRLLAYGVAADDIIPTFRTLGDISSGNKVRLDQLVLAYGQVKAATRLTGAELRQFTEAGVPLLEILGKQLGKSTGEIKDMISANEISFDMTKTALTALNSEGGRFYKNMETQSKTFTGVVSNTRDEFVRFMIGVMGLTTTGEIQIGGPFYYLQLGAEFLLKKLQEVRPVAQAFVQDLLKNMPAVVAIVGALVGLFTPLVIGFVALIAPALLFAAAGAAIAAGIYLLITNFQMLLPYMDIITSVLTGLAVVVIPPLILSFATWAATAIAAATATVVAMLPVIVIAALVAAAVFLLQQAWKTNFLNIQGYTQGFLNWFKNVGIPTWLDNFNVLRGYLTDFIGYWRSIWDKAHESVMKVVDALSKLLEKAREVFANKSGGFKLPGFAHGGTAGGSYADAMPAILHGNERVIPRTGTDVNPGYSTGGSNVTISISGNWQLDSENRVTELADMIISKLNRQNELASKGLGF